MPGARCTRGLVCKLCEECAHEHTGSAETLRHSPRNGFTAYGALFPATNSSCHRHRRIKVLSKPGWARKTSADLTPATGARTTRFCRTQPPVFAERLRRAKASFVLRAGNRSRETRPAITLRADAAASTASSPAFRDDRDTPLLSGKDGQGCIADLPDGLSEVLPVGLICRSHGASG